MVTDNVQLRSHDLCVPWPVNRLEEPRLRLRVYWGDSVCVLPLSIHR